MIPIPTSGECEGGIIVDKELNLELRRMPSATARWWDNWLRRNASANNATARVHVLSRDKYLIPIHASVFFLDCEIFRL